jgi:hypothetical protein
MLIDLNRAEKKLIEDALIRLGLETRPLDLPSEEDIKALWIKLYFHKQELEPVPEYFLLEESDNV